MVTYTYLIVILVGSTFQMNDGCTGKNVIDALYACIKPRGDLNRVGKSAESTNDQKCKTFRAYVACMEPRLKNCDTKLIEAYTVMKERYSTDGRLNCSLFPTTSTTTSCPFDVIFVVDESEIMGYNDFTVNGRNGFRRVNDQIVRYLRSMIGKGSAAVKRAGYITIGMTFSGGRDATKLVTSLSSDLNAVITAIDSTGFQDAGLNWTQVVDNLPDMLTSASKVFILTATSPTHTQVSDVMTRMRRVGAEIYVIGLPFQGVLLQSEMNPFTSVLSNIRIVTQFDHSSVRNELEYFLPTQCSSDTTIEPMTTKEETTSQMSTETREVSTMISDVISTEREISTAVITSFFNIEPTQSSSNTNCVSTIPLLIVFLWLPLVSY